MNERKVLNYCGQIIDLCYALRKQPPNQRYGLAEGIIQLTQNIRHEVRTNANINDDSKH